MSVNNGVELGEEAEEASIVHLLRYLCLIRISSLVGGLKGSVEPGKGNCSLKLNSHISSFYLQGFISFGNTSTDMNSLYT